MPTVGSVNSSLSYDIAPDVGVTKMTGLEDSSVTNSPPLVRYESTVNTLVVSAYLGFVTP